MSYESKSIRDAVDELNRTYYLPAIQREFVWEPERIERLFDSIMGDYPIGSFLFWKVKEENKNDWTCYLFASNYDEEHPHNDIANLSGINKDVYLILDGQQRLTALNVGLRGSYRYFYYRWRKQVLHLNLLKPIWKNEIDPEELEYQFEFRDNGDTQDPEQELWYRVGRILDSEDSEEAKTAIENEIRHLNQEQQSNARKLVGRLHSRIHTYKLVNYHEEKSQDYDKVVQVFIRANTGGKTLEYSDILLSTATAKWKNLNAREEVERSTDNINAIGPGYDFGKDFVLKGSLYLTDGLPIKYQIKNFNKPNLEKIESNWHVITKGLEDSVRLVSRYGFSSKNITSTIALLPIAYYLSRLNRHNYIDSSALQDVRNQNTIQKWLISVLLKNVFGSSSDTNLENLRKELIAINDYSAFEPDQLNAKLGVPSAFSSEEIAKILDYSYGTRYSYLVLSLLFPGRDWKGNVHHEDHIFPKSEFTRAKLRSRGYDNPTIEEYLSRYNAISNLQLLTPSENQEKNAQDFSSWIVTRDSNFKTRHMIPIMDSYGYDEFLEFIEKRRIMLSERLKSALVSA